ncbi:MAG TPA: FAD-binding oxidoreductase [candidate division Zixibacteria bacterium]|nr:FAD-binding oxidoreductase [candidate division Zixibacteria bacterium]HER00092.1 FAD-binding oxidoreductase [candidate division Zixibacteria bacterium]
MENFGANLKGELIRSGDASYDECRAIWNGMIDRRPALIVRCGNQDDVIAAVKFARQYDLITSIRSGGHHVAGKAVCDSGLVIDLSLMNKVEVDPKERIARVQGGAKLGDLDEATSQYNLAAPVGVVSETGVAGLTLHGGFGWHSRKYGLAADNLLSVDVITADGRHLRASKDENQDLFWALRGGGGNFGVVTSFEFKLHPIESEVWLLMTLYPLSKARECMEYFREHMPNTPEEFSMINVFWSAPDQEAIPEQYRGLPVLVSFGCCLGDPDKAEKTIAPFRQISEPIADLSARMPFKEVQKVLDEDYPNGRHYYWKSVYINEISDDTIDRLIEYAENRPSALSSIDVWGLGGQVNRIKPESTAFYQRNAPYMIGIEANWDDPDDSQRNIKWARAIYDEFKNNLDAGLYLNFPGFAEEGEELLAKTYGPNYQKLKDIKAKYDPDNFFRGFMNLSGNGSR